jgi:hypothetical protein
MGAKIKICSDNIIVITGITRSGKTLLCPIVSSLKNCEQFFFNTVVENILVMQVMKKIDFDAADHIIVKAINEIILDRLLGRNLNTRNSDLTSINSYKNKKIYLKRANSDSNKNVHKSKELKKNFFPIMFHEALFNLDLIEKTLNKPKIINISRHPVDLITSWLKKKYGKQFYSKIINGSYTFNYKSEVLPFFCLGIEKIILRQKTNEDRVIKMVSNLSNIFKKNFLKSKNKKNIILIKHDSFVTKPHEHTKHICKKFKLKKTSFLNKVLKEQNCPRNINFDKRKNDYKYILSKLSNENKKIFNKMIHEYESDIVTY